VWQRATFFVVSKFRLLFQTQGDAKKKPKQVFTKLMILKIIMTKRKADILISFGTN